MTENHWVLDQPEIMHHIFGEPLSDVQCTKILPPKIAPIFEDFCVQWAYHATENCTHFRGLLCATCARPTKNRWWKFLPQPLCGDNSNRAKHLKQKSFHRKLHPFSRTCVFNMCSPAQQKIGGENFQFCPHLLGHVVATPIPNQGNSNSKPIFEYSLCCMDASFRGGVNQQSVGKFVPDQPLFTPMMPNLQTKKT